MRTEWFELKACKDCKNNYGMMIRNDNSCINIQFTPLMTLKNFLLQGDWFVIDFWNHLCYTTIFMDKYKSFIGKILNIWMQLDFDMSRMLHFDVLFVYIKRKKLHISSFVMVFKLWENNNCVLMHYRFYSTWRFLDHNPK